jgi:chitinase
MMRSGKVLLLGAALLLAACGTTQPARPPRYRIIAYVRGRADIPRISAQKLTHVNYAFGVVDNTGEVHLKTADSLRHLRQLEALKTKNPHLKVILSVGGWGADNFSDAALTDASRRRFAASAIRFVTSYDLDGIDLDWEYPGQRGPGIKFRPEDKQNFTLLLKDIRERLDVASDEQHRTGGDRYTLSIASAAGRYFDHTEMDRLHVYLDWINVMTYDFFGSHSQTTGHHTALYGGGSLHGKPLPSAAAFVEQHLAAGIPPEKIVVGIAFYGRGWTGVTADANGLHQPYAGWTVNYSYSTIERSLIGQQGFTRYWDRAAHAPYLWSPSLGVMISYEDPQSVREKARFVKRHRLGGVMYWEHSHDPAEVLLDVLYRNLR